MKVRLLKELDCVEKPDGTPFVDGVDEGPRRFVRRPAGYVLEHPLPRPGLECGHFEPADEASEAVMQAVRQRQAVVREKKISRQRAEYERVQAEQRATEQARTAEFAAELGVEIETDPAPSTPPAEEDAGVRAPTRLAGADE